MKTITIFVIGIFLISLAVAIDYNFIPIEEEMSDEEVAEILEQFPNETEEIDEDVFSLVEVEFREQLEQELLDPEFEEVTNIPEVKEIQTEYIREENYYVEVIKNG
jgi:hypothetical protein